MLDLTDMELCYLLRVVTQRIKDLDWRLERNRRYFSNPDDEVEFYKKVGVFEDEREKMIAIRDKIKTRIAFIEMLSQLRAGQEQPHS